MKCKIKIPREALESSCMPKSFWELGNDTYPFSNQSLKTIKIFNAKILEACRVGAILTLYGEGYTGKTYLATLPMKFAILEGLTTRYTTMTEMFELYMSRNDFGATVLSPDLLVIDDILMVKHDGYSRCLGTVIRSRTDAGKSTLMCVEIDGSKQRGTSKPTLKWLDEYRVCMGAKYDKFSKEVYCEASVRTKITQKSGAERIFGDA